MEDLEYCVTKFFTLVVVLLSLHAYAVNASSSECHFPAIYNFGDSNSDTGGLSAAFGQNIYSQGGRSFWIHNTGPVGCLPYVLDRLIITSGQIDSVGCASPFNDVCQFYNTKLKEAVEQLRKDLPSAAITYVDVYSVKYDLISHASKYGFAHPLRACCGHGGKYNYNRNVLCGGKIKVNGTEVLVGTCQNPSVMINWDGVHYTEAANKWIFDQIVDGSYSDPPNSLKMACRTAS